MKTPYDTALRVERRALDALRLSISVTLERISRVESECAAHDATILAEAVDAIGPFPADAWRARMRMRRAHLVAEAREAEARLTALRSQAVEAYGTVRAIESAATSYRDEAERAAALAEQAQADDLVGARYARMARVPKRRTA